MASQRRIAARLPGKSIERCNAFLTSPYLFAFWGTSTGRLIHAGDENGEADAVGGRDYRRDGQDRCAEIVGWIVLRDGGCAPNAASAFA